MYRQNLITMLDRAHRLSVEQRVVTREVVSSTPAGSTLRTLKELSRKRCLCDYISKDVQVFSNEDYKPGSVSRFLQLSTLWDVKEPTHLSKRVGHEVPDVVAAIFSKVAGSKYTCKRLRVLRLPKFVNSP